MKIIKRDPLKGYIDRWLWVPKAYMNIEGTKRALTFQFADPRTQGPDRILVMWQETEHHLVVPRSFYKLESVPYEIVDLRPQEYSVTGITSRVKLDHRPSGGVLKPTGKNVQQKSIEALMANPGGVLQLSCGAGKSPTSLDFIARMGVPALVIIPDTQLMEQWRGEIEKHLDVPGGIGLIQAEAFDWKKGIVLATYHTIAARAAELSEEVRRWFGVVIHEECFPAGTKIDGTPIEELKTGMLVSSYNHQTNKIEKKTILRTFKTAAQTLITITLSNGLKLVCTPGHPIYTRSRGYVPASELKTTDTLYGKDSTNSSLQLLRRDGHSQGQVGTRASEESSSGLLLQRTQHGIPSNCVITDGEQNKQEACLGAHEDKKSDAQRGESRKNEQNTKSYGMETTSIRRERTGTYATTSLTEGGSRRALGLRSDRSNRSLRRRKQDANTLRDRYSPCRENDCGGSRRTFAPSLEQTSQRRKERFVPSLIGVESIETHQQGNTERSSSICADSFVYNIEVEGNNNYFAEGILVHNCHHLSAPTFSACADAFYGNRISLSATPERQDGYHIICDYHVGPIIYKNLSQDLNSRVVFKWTGLEVDETAPGALVRDKSGEIHLGLLSSYYGRWAERTALILEDVNAAIAAGRKVLVLSNSIDECVNLCSMWNSRSWNSPFNLYTDIPTPSETDVGETIIPEALEPRELVKLEKVIAAIEKKIVKDPNSIYLQQQLNGYLQRLKQHEVYKKVQGELGRRKRKYIKDLQLRIVDGGLMIHEVPAKQRSEYKKLPVLFSIAKYGKEGLDSPMLDTVMVSTPFSSKGSLQQVKGRGERHFPGKQEPVLIFYEDNIGPIIGMCKKLRSHLNQWPTDEGGPFDYELHGHPFGKKQVKPLF